MSNDPWKASFEMHKIFYVFAIKEDAFDEIDRAQSPFQSRYKIKFTPGTVPSRS